MNYPVDLTNMREMTGGDAALENMLFGEFFKSAESCIGGMADTHQTLHHETFRKNAHAFKGIALNIGANQLSALCKEAQDGCALPASDKSVLLQCIREEYVRVKNYLENIME